MKAIQKINLDFAKQGVTPRIPVVQGDLYSRLLEISLTSNGEPWHIPQDVSALIRYRKPNRTSGVYDTLPDGTRAYTLHGNTITIGIAPDVLTLAGDVSLIVSLVSGQQLLSTFEIILAVQPNYSGWRSSEGAGCRISGFLAAPENAKVGQILAVEKTNNAGMVEKVKAIDFANISDLQGISPTAKVEETATGAIITITDQNGTTTATITNGTDGHTPVKRVDYPEIVVTNMLGTDNRRGVKIESYTEDGTGRVTITGGTVYDGKDGNPGKSAYEYARDAGYTGTEAEFAEKMASEPQGQAQEPLVVTVTLVNETAGNASHTAAEIHAAYASGRRVVAHIPYMGILTLIVPLIASADAMCAFASSSLGLSGDTPSIIMLTVYDNGAAMLTMQEIELPDRLPCPSPLWIGNQMYDGSSYVDMSDVINGMIDAKLGVIENGAY